MSKLQQKPKSSKSEQLRKCDTQINTHTYLEAAIVCSKRAQLLNGLLYQAAELHDALQLAIKHWQVDDLTPDYQLAKSHLNLQYLQWLLAQLTPIPFRLRQDASLFISLNVSRKKTEIYHSNAFYND